MLAFRCENPLGYSKAEPPLLLTGGCFEATDRCIVLLWSGTCRVLSDVANSECNGDRQQGRRRGILASLPFTANWRTLVEAWLLAHYDLATLATARLRPHA
jgi:hypothetical protein